MIISAIGTSIFINNALSLASNIVSAISAKRIWRAYVTLKSIIQLDKVDSYYVLCDITYNQLGPNLVLPQKRLSYITK